MATIPGASSYLGSATLANGLGIAPSTPTVISQSSSTVSLLDSGRNLTAGNGIGLSSSARQINDQYLSQTSGLFNQLLSLSAGTDSTIEGALIQIEALRSTLPVSSLGASVIDIEA